MGDLNFKSIIQGILLLTVLFILAYFIWDYLQKRSVQEEFDNYEYLSGGLLDDAQNVSNTKEEANLPLPMHTQPPQQQQMPMPMPMPPHTESIPRPVPVIQNNMQKAETPTDCFPKDKLTPEELLPRDAANSEWAQVNPSGQGCVKNQNFLTSGYHMGINSIGSTLRNPNLQLRSEPPNPRERVGPWMQSTIEPDLNRRPLEINGCD